MPISLVPALCKIVVCYDTVNTLKQRGRGSGVLGGQGDGVEDRGVICCDIDFILLIRLSMIHLLVHLTKSLYE